MTIDKWLKSTRQKLTNSSTPDLDAVVILAYALGVNKTWLYAHSDHEVDSKTLRRLAICVKKRQSNVPIAYITGKQEFYGREFLVNKNVLVPRPESESLIDLVKQFCFKHPIDTPRIADVGAGSGCLGITAALELHSAGVDVYDCDIKTFHISKQNARRYPALRAQYYKSDILQPNWGPYELILANLPYVPDGYDVNKAALHEPALALYAGKDGLDAYRKLFEQLADLTWEPQCVVTESLHFQHTSLDAIAERYGYSLYLYDGLARLYIPK